MTNAQVIKAFLNHRHGKALNLYTMALDNGIALVNYKTIIATINGKQLGINACKYSRTTSKIQTELKSQAKDTDYIINYYNVGKSENMSTW